MIDQLTHAWRAAVDRDRAQVERAREVEDPADFYAPVTSRFRLDPRRTDDDTLNALLALALREDVWVDVGAGGGRYALPLALQTHEVIAIDSSPSMLRALRDDAAANGIENVRVIEARWPMTDPPAGDVGLMAHVGYDIAEIGAFLDQLEAQSRRLCVAVLGESAMTTVATLFWQEIHGEPRVRLPALSELVALLRARGRLPSIQLVDRTPPSFSSFDEALAMARRQLWLRQGSPNDQRLRELAQGTLVEREGRYAFEWQPTKIGIVTWVPPGEGPRVEDDMTATQLTQQLDPVLARLAAAIDRYDAEIDSSRVAPNVAPAEIRAHLSAYTFEDAIPLPDLVDQVASMLHQWSLHVTHPRYFGLFNPTVRRAGVFADALAALYNPQLAAWPHAPIANEIERHVLARFMRAFGLDPETGIANFTTGGQEANQTAVTVALTRAFEAYGERGVGALDGPPVLYVSGEAHHSFVKIAHQSGIGRASVRHVRVDAQLRMDVDDLRRQLDEDKARGAIPFLIVATAGTTAAGAIDPIPELAAIAAEHRLWLHVDAAWGGAAIVAPSLRHHLAGIELADSITCDAHKWMSVPVGAGMFFCRHREPTLQAFRVEASSYVPAAVPDTFDPYVSSIQWSRRFIGLKLFMVLAELGWDGLGELVAEQARTADLLRSLLAERGWRIVTDSPLAVVCFTHPDLESGAVTVGAVVDRLVAGGRAWISHVRLAESAVALRACITSHRTTRQDLDVLLDELDRAITPP
ncbi:MAG TPA: aminotransferase class V-fold PLP-dependent enzyme [Candidatus Limnocylindrales bacterium]|nr:aminotransferase class V-fold PLP-dependent enzyme [Candidatus Limnocylindrales bacterium]